MIFIWLGGFKGIGRVVYCCCVVGGGKNIFLGLVFIVGNYKIRLLYIMGFILRGLSVI